MEVEVGKSGEGRISRRQKTHSDSNPYWLGEGGVADIYYTHHTHIIYSNEAITTIILQKIKLSRVLF